MTDISHGFAQPTAASIGQHHDDPEMTAHQQELNNAAAALESELSGLAQADSLTAEDMVLYRQRAEDVFRQAQHHGIVINGYQHPQELIDKATKKTETEVAKKEEEKRQAEQSSDKEQQRDETIETIETLATMASIAGFLGDMLGEGVDADVPGGPASDMKTEGYVKPQPAKSSLPPLPTHRRPKD